MNVFTEPHKVFPFLLFSLLPVSNAQNKVTIKSGVDKNKIVIGEQVHSLWRPIWCRNQCVFLIDSILHFEILERKIDTVDDRQGINYHKPHTPPG